MQKIIPHLWFDKEAKDAANFYASIFTNSEITSVKTIHDTPSGDCDIVSFKIRGVEFMAISAGPYFKINPSVSFMVNFDPSQESNPTESLKATWEKLSDGGKVLMPLDKYPFSELYGWVEDKYGVSWQLIFTSPEGEERPQIIPCLLFTGEVYGKTESAFNFYLDVFRESKAGVIMKYPSGQEPNKEGTVMFSDFKLFDLWFAAMDGGGQHDFQFNEAVSFIVNCETQEEIDYYWEKLSAVPESEQCGWLKDKFGLSWQINPTRLGELMNSTDEEVVNRVTQAFLKMKKFNIAELEQAAKG